MRTRPTLRPTAALVLQASIITFFLAASSAPTPLYATYQAAWHFSSITTTIVFGVYALAVLAALLVAGKLSDYVGRRPVLLTTLVLQAAAMAIFTTADSVTALLAARVVQGLATGAAAGAVGAGLLDIDRARGTLANAVAPLTGTASGSLISGLFVAYLPMPTHLVYLVLLGVFAVQFVGVLAMSETVSRAPGAIASLKPEIALPPQTRAPFLVATSALVAVWALPGFYGSLGPALVRTITGSSSPVLGGLALFVMAGTGALTVLLARAIAPRTVMRYGAVTLIIGVGLTLVAITTTSSAALFTGMVLAGSGFGAGFQGAVRTVVPLALPHQRAGVLSALYVVSYMAMGLPAVIGGFLVVYDGGLISTARVYAIAVITLAALALLGLMRRSRPAATDEPSVRESASTPEVATAERKFTAAHGEQRVLAGRGSQAEG